MIAGGVFNLEIGLLVDQYEDLPAWMGIHGDDRLELQIVKPCGAGGRPAVVSKAASDRDLGIAVGIEHRAVIKLVTIAVL